MSIPKQLLQIRLSTLLLLTLVVALVVILISNSMYYSKRIEKLERQVDVFSRHLPEYNLAVETHRLNAELEQAREYYGPAHPIVQDLETKLVVLARQKKLEAGVANSGKK